MQSRVILFVMAMFATAPAFAQEGESPWSGKATLGYLATSGNTENSNLNSGFELGYRHGDWQHQVAARAINATENETTTAEAYELGWKSERRLSETDSLFGRLDWRKDRFSSYETQFSQTVGYGRRLIDGERHELNGELGLGARQSELVDGTSEEEFIVRGGLDYRWILSNSAEFTQEVAVESGGDNTYAESITALSAKLVGNLALVASYTVKHNTEVLPLTENTDTYTALSLEYVW